MKKIVFFAVSLFILSLTFISCSHRASPTDPFISSTATPSASYTNSGKIKSTGMDTYIDFLSMTINASATYYYDSSGKIRYETEYVSGVSGGNINFNYNSNGKLISKITPAGGGSDNTYYAYDSSNRLSSLIVVTDGTANTKIAQTFTYDANNRISRIDESDNGSPASFRLITRDASGYDASEIIYYPGTMTQLGTITFTRNAAAKTISVALTLLGMSGDSLDVIYSYDSTGFVSTETVIMPVFGENFTISNVLQNGPFDAGGMNGYYYTDPDIYGMTYISATGEAE